MTTFLAGGREMQQGPSSLTESTQAGTGHERRGLDWVLALARVEYGAMLATFTPQEAPFAVVRPSQYEFAAYQHLLTDGALTHYWALVRDPLLRRVAGMTPGPEMLAYIRRFNLARHFLHAAAHSRAEELNAVQFAELTEQDKYLRDKYDGFRVIVAHYVDRQSFRRTSSATRTVEWARACGAQLRAETAEIQLGTARIEYRE